LYWSTRVRARSLHAQDHRGEDHVKGSGSLLFYLRPYRNDGECGGRRGAAGWGACRYQARARARPRGGSRASRTTSSIRPLPSQRSKTSLPTTAIVIGAGTRFGRLSSQMANFLDQTGGLWARGALHGKVGGAFTSTATQHGGQETTLFSIITNLLHFGMVIVGLDYGHAGQMTLEEITGGSPYGATTIAGGDGSRRRPRTSSRAPATRAARSRRPPTSCTADTLADHLQDGLEAPTCPTREA